MPRIEYWLQIENQSWDAAPNGFDRTTGQALVRAAGGLFRPLSKPALLIRRYTANWAAPDDHLLNEWDLNEPSPLQTHGTLPGATIEAKVGDELVIHFRNMDMRSGVPDIERLHSLHLHGVQHKAGSDGAYPFSPNDPSQANKRGDKLAPGDTFDYQYSVPHLSTAGVWAYYDGAISQQASIGLGACGAVIVRAGGESRPAPAPAPLRSATDTVTRFANIPPPGGAVEHLLILHELLGIGTCINGRQLPGNTPTLLGRMNTRIKFRVLNFALRAHVFHLHGHRWKRGDDWTDNETIPPGGGFVFDLQEGTVENGGSNGEWGITIPTAPSLMSSLVITDGGVLALTTGA